MPAPKYLLDKIARHGSAAQRLIDEREQNRGEFASHGQISAIAFDAADFVWAYFALHGDDSIQESRQIRNSIAGAIIEALERVIDDEGAAK